MPSLFSIPNWPLAQHAFLYSPFLILFSDSVRADVFVIHTLNHGSSHRFCFAKDVDATNATLWPSVLCVIFFSSSDSCSEREPSSLRLEWRHCNLIGLAQFKGTIWKCQSSNHWLIRCNLQYNYCCVWPFYITLCTMAQIQYTFPDKCKTKQ